MTSKSRGHETLWSERLIDAGLVNKLFITYKQIDKDNRTRIIE